MFTTRDRDDILDILPRKNIRHLWMLCQCCCRLQVSLRPGLLIGDGPTTGLQSLLVVCIGRRPRFLCYGRTCTSFEDGYGGLAGGASIELGKNQKERRKQDSVSKTDTK